MAKKLPKSSSGNATGRVTTVSAVGGFFKKIISRPGKRFVRRHGKLIEEDFTVDRLKKIALGMNEQLAAGNYIPAPFVHYKDDSGSKKVIGQPSSDGTLPADFDPNRFIFDPSLNAGYWKEGEFVEDASKINAEWEPGPALIGKLEAPGDPTDPNTIAGKVGTTMKEVSMLVLPKHVDGNNREWEDYLTHVCLTNHPVEKQQNNFALAFSEEEYPEEISLSEVGSAPQAADPTGQDDPQIVELLTLLRQAPIKLDLPEDTGRDNLIEVMMIAVRQKVADAKDSQQQFQPPPGSQSRPAPVAMSEENANTEALNPMVSALINGETNRRKDVLRKRVSKMKANGIVRSKETLDDLNSQIDAIALSEEDVDADGNFKPSPVEGTIATLEREGRPLTGNDILGSGSDFLPPQGSEDQDPPAVGEEEMPADAMESILDRNFSNN